MSSSMMSSATVSSVNRIQASAITPSIAPFSGLRSIANFPGTRKSTDITKLVKDVGRVSCMKVWTPLDNKRFETLSYLPPLSVESLAKEVDYLIRMGWVPCLEFDLQGFVYRDNGNTPGYYDGRYWTMWKLPMFGCTDSSQVVKELEECKKEYPNAFIRIIGFDNKRQVQCVSFIAAKPGQGN